MATSSRHLRANALDDGSRIRQFLLGVIAIVLLTACLAIAPATASAITSGGWGIADNVRDRPLIDSDVAHNGAALNTKIDTFMERLSPKVYRLQVPYDIAINTDPRAVARLSVLKREITLARQRGAQSVLVTFIMGYADSIADPIKKWSSNGTVNDFPGVPGVTYYKYAVEKAILALDPLGVDAWSPANEPNAGWRWFRGDHDETFGPKALADLFKTLLAIKPLSDQIVSPEFHDSVDSQGYPNLVGTAGLSDNEKVEHPEWANWTTTRHFIYHYQHNGGGWGNAAAYHPYGAVNEVRPNSIDDFEALVPSGTPIWLTEIGSKPTTVPNTNPTPSELGTQTAKTRFLINYLNDPSPTHQHIQRAYYYNPWDDGKPWDTALLNNDGSPRPAYTLWAEQSRASNTLARLASTPTISPRQSFAGDFDANGRGDIGLRDVDTGDVKVRLGTSWADTPEVRFNWAVGGHYQMFSGRFNGDQFTDIGLRNAATGTIYFRYGPQFLASGETAMAWATGQHYQPFGGDFNNDGIGDVGLRDPFNGGIYFRAGPGFTSETSFGWAPDSAGQIYKPFAGDMNGDGKTDIGVFNQANGWFSYKAGPGPYYGAQTNFQWAYGQNYTPLVADWNGDGKLDVGLRDLNNGTWYFRTSPNLGAGSPETTYDWTRG